MTMEELTFDIETQAAAAITNIGGDALIDGGVQGSATWETLELRRAISRAQDGVAELALTQPVLDEVNRSLGAASEEAAKSKPDRSSVAEHLATATDTLREADALVDAGGSVLDSLRRAVALLGPIGLAVVGAL
jgi:hypothetical protein